MHSSSAPWKRRSLRGSIQLEQVPLMEDSDSPKLSRSGSSSSISINDDKVPLDTSPKMRTIADLLIVFIVLLLSETARGIVLPTLSPYVTLIGGNAVMLGYAVAAFSIGRFASTIGLGYLSTRLSYKKVLAGSVAICVAGNLMYGLAFFLGPYFMLASRFLTGFGAGTLSVIRAYVAHVTTTKERTSFMSILGAVQFLGFAIMPGAGSLLAFIPEFEIAGMPFNKFTMPGYVLAISSLALLLLIIFEFKNPPPLETKEDIKTATPAPIQEPPPLAPAFVSPLSPHSSNHSPVLGSIYHPQSINTGYLPSPHFHPQQLSDVSFHPQFPAYISPPHFPPAFQSLSPPPYPPTLSPYSPQFHPQFSEEPSYSPNAPLFKVEEPTLSSPRALSPSTEPQLTRTERFLIFGVFLILNLMVRLVLGIIETIATPVYMDLSGNKPGKDVEAGFVFGGLGLIGMGVLFLISYLSKHVADFKILVAGLCTMVLGSGLLIGDVSLARFIVGCGFIWCIGYPLAQTIIVSMFSKMLGSKPQGTMMGWIGAMGSLGRVIGPIVSGFLLDLFGQSATMIFGTAIAAVSLVTSLLLLRVKERLH